MRTTMAAANRALRNLPDAVGGEVRTLSGQTAAGIANSAKADVPVSPGTPRHIMHLRDTIQWAYSGKIGAVVRVPKFSYHWKFLEFGTVHMAASGMFRRAADQRRAGHKAALVKLLVDASQRMTG